MEKIFWKASILQKDFGRSSKLMKYSSNKVIWAKSKLKGYHFKSELSKITETDFGNQLL